MYVGHSTEGRPEVRQGSPATRSVERGAEHLDVALERPRRYVRSHSHSLPHVSFHNTNDTDYTTLLTLLTPSSPEHRTAQRALGALKPRAEAAQKRETDEMLGKLKGLGNSILGACAFCLLFLVR